MLQCSHLTSRGSFRLSALGMHISQETQSALFSSHLIAEKTDRSAYQDGTVTHEDFSRQADNLCYCGGCEITAHSFLVISSEDVTLLHAFEQTHTYGIQILYIPPVSLLCSL